MQYTADFFLFSYYDDDADDNTYPYGKYDVSGLTGTDLAAWNLHNKDVNDYNPTVNYHRVEGLDSTLDCDSCTSEDDQTAILTLAE